MSKWAARAIALYLPQFHPCPTTIDGGVRASPNGQTSLARVRCSPDMSNPESPQISGSTTSDSPRPAKRKRSSRRLTASRHSASGTTGFGNGRRILECPFNEVSSSDQTSMSFCLGWANESWTGVWHGAKNRILAEQIYSDSDDRAHFDALLPAFRDDRYFRVNDRPVLYVYRPAELPDAARFVDRWQQMARAAGLGGLHLVAANSHDYWGFRADGFDAAFQQRLPFAPPVGGMSAVRFRHKILRHPIVYRYSRERSRAPLNGDGTCIRASCRTSITRRDRDGTASFSRTPSPSTSARTCGTPWPRSPTDPGRNDWCG